MSGEIDFKSKYLNLKAQYKSSVDVAFRLGYEQGARDSQINSAMEQQQAAQEKEQAGQPGAPGQQVNPGEEPNEEGKPGQPGQSANEEPNETPDSVDPSGSELDKHIETLEGMLGKSETLEGDDLKKALNEIKSFKQKIAIRKNDRAIKSIAKSMKKPTFALGKQATVNLSDSAKNSLSLQEKIVGDVMKKWEDQERSASKDIFSVLAIENLTKKE